MKVLFLFLVATFTFVAAQEVPSLEKCFYWALQNNVDIEVTKFGPRIAEQDIGLATSPFHDIFIGAKASYTKLDSRLEQSEQANFSVNLAKRFLLGTEVAVDYRIDYLDTTDLELAALIGAVIGDDDFIVDKISTSALTFQVTQPLLRNFGFDVNSAFIDIAKKQKEIANAEIERQINDTLTQVEIAYWTWISFLKIQKALQISIREGEKYKSKYVEPKAGLTEGVLPSDVDQARIDVQLRKDQLITVERQIKEWEDKLKRLIFPLDSKKESLSKTLPIWQDGLSGFTLTNFQLPDFEYETALKNRPELKQIQGQAEAFHILSKQKQNQLLPEVNLVGRYTFIGQAQEENIAIANTIDGNHYQWHLGVEFEYTLGTLGVRSDYKKALLQKQQSQAQKKQIEYDICLEIKLSRHAVEEALRKYNNTTSLLQKAQERLIGVERRYQQPLPYDFNLIFFVQDAEVQRTEAQVNQYRAILQYKIAMAQLKRAQAKYLQTIYKKYRIK
ncbi:TolC family protein [Candidatus Uabimicrobium amorphum]|uniref:RND transporter n=1 Tax=Uabimicrobium amorphum TaxID=2596890 RepID=A0A5S9ILK4_UABAM|nr:TolC family protein [Candidatus Uabimicrobium amorphum]BBM83781.1 RND transporter [Candidatus Uabimicrobium amorphum]